MSRTDWTKMVTGKELATEKNLRKKLLLKNAFKTTGICSCGMENTDSNPTNMWHNQRKACE